MSTRAAAAFSLLTPPVLRFALLRTGSAMQLLEVTPRSHRIEAKLLNALACRIVRHVIVAELHDEALLDEIPYRARYCVGWGSELADGSGLEWWGVFRSAAELPRQQEIAKVRELLKQFSSGPSGIPSPWPRNWRSLCHDLLTPAQTAVCAIESCGRDPIATDQDLLTAARTALFEQAEILQVALQSDQRAVDRTEPTEIRSLLTRLVQTFGYLADRNRISIFLSAAPEVIVFVPRTDVWRILANLLVNAIRNTRTGWVKLECEVEEAVLRVCVTDTGSGFPLEQFLQRGDRRFKGEGSQGFGYGLPTVIDLCQRYGIAVDVRRLTFGSRFRVTFPNGSFERAKPCRSEVQAVSDLRSQGRELASPAVIVFDDNRAAAHALARRISHFGAKIASANSKEEATRLVEEAPDAVMLLDYDLGTETAIEFLSQLTVVPRRIVICTGSSRAVSHEKLLPLTTGREVLVLDKLRSADTIWRAITIPSEILERSSRKVTSVRHQEN